MIGRKQRSGPLVVAALGMLSIGLVAVAAQIGPPATGSDHATPVPREPGPAALERLSGFYLYADNTVATIKRDGQHLTIQFPGERSATGLYPLSEDTFTYTDTRARIHFVRDAAGTPVAAVLQQNGVDTRMARVDAGAAARTQQATAAKVRSNSATPGSEAALAALLDGLAAGHPDLSRVNPQLAGAISKDVPQFQAALAALGARKAIDFVEVAAGGLDVYRVEHEHGSARWSIKLDSSGTIVSLFWEPPPGVS